MLKNARWLAGAALAAGYGCLVLLVNSCSTGGAGVVAPAIDGATFVGDKSCADCHNNIARVFPSSPHARLHLENSAMAGNHGCESCHGPASKHIAMAGRGGRERFIINPGREPSACLKCHADVETEFHFAQHHPVLEGKMNCVQCHDPHGMDIMKHAGGLGMARLNETCAECHRMQAKPVVFEHPALREGCVSCHSPHGSINAQLLTVRDSNLCLRCHAQAQGPGTKGAIYIGSKNHANYLRYGTCWTAGCHTAVHGSNVQPYLLY